MKKLLVILLLISYSVASYGVTLNYFYCCGKLKTVSINEIKKEDNNCPGKKNKKCCKYKKVQIKLKADQKQTPKVDFTIHAPSIVAPIPQNTLIAYTLIEHPISIIQLQKPPPLYPEGSNIYYCVFKI
ncbi:MAG: hypothetical protein JST23_06925 [Bacteroidetes bacterium]|nr:hypothetical protein [Bacteroidota bacterium]